MSQKSSLPQAAKSVSQVLMSDKPRGAVSRVPPSEPPSQNQVGGVCCGGVVTQFFDIENKGDVVRLGLNHRFGDRREVVPLK